MQVFRTALFAVAIGLTGCTTDRPLPDAVRSTSLIDYMQALRRETSTLLDTVVAASTTPVEDTPAYRAWGDHWCPRHVLVHSTDDVVRGVSDYCINLAGTFREPYCTRNSAPDQVLFYAQFQRNIDLCQGVAATVSIQIVEPKPGNVADPRYVDRLRTLGYRTAGDDARAALAALSAAEAERARLARELPRLRTRGTRVCHTDADVTFVGFVEDTSGGKIKIDVQQAYTGNGTLGSLGIRNPNYRPETIWDQPERWTVCE